MSLCEDCPPVGYPTDKTRCAPCPRRAALRGRKRALQSRLDNLGERIAKASATQSDSKGD